MLLNKKSDKTNDVWIGWSFWYISLEDCIAMFNEILTLNYDKIINQCINATLFHWLSLPFIKHVWTNSIFWETIYAKPTRFVFKHGLGKKRWN